MLSVDVMRLHEFKEIMNHRLLLDKNTREYRVKYLVRAVASTSWKHAR